jgi:hypothetical protein
MESRLAHARPFRHVLSAEQLRVLGVEVLQDPSDSAEVRVLAGQSGHGVTRLAHRAVRDRRFREPLAARACGYRAGISETQGTG